MLSNLTLADGFEYMFYILIIPLIYIRFKVFKYDILKAEIIELIFDAIFFSGFSIFTIQTFTNKKLLFVILLLLALVFKVYVIFKKLDKERLD